MSTTFWAVDSTDGWKEITVSGGGGGGLTLISDTLLVASAASFSVTSIPNTGAALMIEATLRSDFAGTGDFGAMQFNGDTGSHYYYEYVQGSSSSASAGSGNPVAYIPLSANGAAATASAFGTTRADIHSYAGPNLKVGQQQRGQIQTIGSDTTFVAMVLTFLWNDTAAISRIDCAPGGGGTVWVAGSRFTVWTLA